MASINRPGKSGAYASLQEPTPEIDLSPDNAQRLLEMLGGFEGFSSTNQQPTRTFGAIFRCVDPRCSTNHILGLARGSSFIASSPGAIVEEVPKDYVSRLETLNGTASVMDTPSFEPHPADQLAITLRIAGTKVQNGLLIVKTHSDCAAIRNIIGGTADPFLMRHAPAIFREAYERAKHEHDTATVATLERPRSEWNGQMKKGLAFPLEKAIAAMGVKRLKNSLAALNMPEEARPIVLGMVYHLGLGPDAPKPDLLMLHEASGHFVSLNHPGIRRNLQQLANTLTDADADETIPQIPQGARVIASPGYEN